MGLSRGRGAIAPVLEGGAETGERVVTLRRGDVVRLRPIRPDDEAGLMSLYRRLSQHTAYQRFFSVRPLRPEEAHAFAHVDYRERMAVVAEIDTDQGPTLIGVARYGPSSEARTADVAFVVEDDWQGRGLGPVLLGEILRAGERRGINRFSADVLADNRRMLHLLARDTSVIHRTTSDAITHLIFRRRADDSPETEKS